MNNAYRRQTNQQHDRALSEIWSRPSKKQARQARALSRKVIGGWDSVIMRFSFQNVPAMCHKRELYDSHCPLVMGMWEFDHELLVCIQLHVLEAG